MGTASETHIEASGAHHKRQGRQFAGLCHACATRGLHL